MKYLRLYENYTLYDVDDYILLDVELMLKHNKADEILDYVVPDSLAIIEEFRNYSKKYPFLVRSANNLKSYVQLDEIVRKLKPEEIEEFKMKQNRIKFNL